LGDSDALRQLGSCADASLEHSLAQVGAEVDDVEQLGLVLDAHFQKLTDDPGAAYLAAFGDTVESRDRLFAEPDLDDGADFGSSGRCHGLSLSDVVNACRRRHRLCTRMVQTTERHKNLG
jgi:hypothetical protein